MADEKKTKRFYVSGQVQGVGYRFFVQRIADELGLSGYAKNLSDGRVEVLAVGRSAELEALRGQLRRGPHLAQVEDVEEIDASVEAGLTVQGFSIGED